VTTTDRGHHLVLVGMMGVGKTTVGHRVADALGRPFLDSDEEIERRTGLTVAQIFEADGEAAFRAIETDVLLDALASPEPVVIAAAGGTVLSERNRQALDRAGTVVWLRAPTDLLVPRVVGSTHRPAIAADPAGTLARLADDREELYAEVADTVVDASSDVDTVVGQVLRAVTGGVGSASGATRP
jgi:shikimate kinase